MKPTMSLAWKEWHEVRAFLWIGLGVFLGLPLIGGLEEWFSHVHRFHLWTTGWVIGFGGVLAVFVAVGATCRDFNGHLEDFWRSRPIGAIQWLLVKYFAGLAVVLTACVIPLAVQWSIERDTLTQQLILLYPFFWTAVYSIAFLAGCLIRRTAQAAMIALAGMLLLSFLPMILPPLRWIDVAELIDNNGDYLLTQFPWPCAAGLLAVAIVLLTLALLAVRRSWRIESGKKMMYGSIASAILILFASAAFQLGTNLPILRQIDLPPGENAIAIRKDTTGFYVITQRLDKWGNLAERTGPAFIRHALEFTDSGIELHGAIPSNNLFGFRDSYFEVTSPQDPSLRYFLLVNVNGDQDSLSLYAESYRWDGSRDLASLWTQNHKNSGPILYAIQNRLYVIGSHLMTLDISQPLQPRILSDVPFKFALSWAMYDPSNVILPPIPSLAPQDRLKIVLKYSWQSVFDGRTYCEWRGDVLVGYRLSDLTEKRASFVKIGQYESTMLERVFGAYHFGEMQMSDGLLYLSEGGAAGQTFNAHISVFDTRSPTPMRPAGHFAAPNTWGLTVCPLSDGRALVGGNKIWLVGPPPGHYNSGQ